MNSWEKALLQFLAVGLSTAGTLFVHNQKSVAIFNASDELFNGVVAQMTAPTPAPPAVEKSDNIA